MNTNYKQHTIVKTLHSMQKKNAHQDDGRSNTAPQNPPPETWLITNHELNVLVEHLAT
jgi:hypothetical protein